MLKLKHLRRPFRTLSVARDLFAAHLSMKVLGPRGVARFRDDARYDLQNVADGLRPRQGQSGDDTAILERISNAYVRAAETEAFVKPVYRPTAWWKEVRREGLASVRRALAARDIVGLERMYGNFFRDPCSTGLVGAPYKMNKAHLGQAADESSCRFFLSNALYRIDYWNAQTGNRFALDDLAGPEIGNPFGVCLDGTLVRAGTESKHYSAHRIMDLLPPQNVPVVEIGGGFGSMAYYLLRDRPGTTYVNFDVPESIALASYYLLKSFPDRRFLLYGEEPLSADSLSRFPVVLMPVFELPNMPTKGAVLTFSANTLSSLTRAAMAEYLQEIHRTTNEYLLLVGRAAESGPLRRLIRLQLPDLTLAEKRVLEWNKLKILNDLEEECLYRLPREAAELSHGQG
jgi:putative sugar O-methyltransferase